MQSLFTAGQHLCIPAEIGLILIKCILIFFTTKKRMLFAEPFKCIISAVQHNANRIGVSSDRIVTIFKYCCISVKFQCIDLLLQVGQNALNRSDFTVICINTTGIGIHNILQLCVQIIEIQKLLL